MPLNSKQKEAVEYLSGPLLVLAGPGTGKTQLLSSKVAHILENTDTSPENILCLTFTEVGAENMRTRLFSMIGQAASSVNIHTYHAFGSNILSAYKNYATDFSRNLDSPIDEITQHKIIRKIQENLAPGDILRGDKISDIVSTISSAKSARLTASDLAKIAADNIKVANELNPKLSNILDSLVPRMKFANAVKTVYQPLLETMAAYAKPEPLAGNIEREVNSWIFELNHIIDSETAKEKPSVSPLSSWKKRHFEKGPTGNWRLSNIVSNKKLSSLANIMQLYDEELQSNGLFDFSDMIEEAISALKHDSGFRLTLSERYQYILLDEFQDTNPSQAELIYLLTDYESPSIMAVGDDDQAIFAFQGANASNLIDFQQHYNAKVITLTDNYRSTSQILDFSHKIADQITSSFAKSHDIEKILTAKRDFNATELSRHEFLSSDSEYYYVANAIEELINSGVNQSDIAIITPKHKYVAPLLPYLKSHPKINIAYEKRDNLFEDSKISKLLKLSRFIYNLANGNQSSYLLPEILSFDFWQIDPLTILKICTYDRHDPKTIVERLATSEDDRLKNVAILIGNLVQNSFDTPLELFINQLLRDADFLNFYEQTEEYESFTLYENLAVLREAIKSHLKTDRPLLKDLIEFLDDYEAANQPLTNTSPYQDSSDSVQILTAHKSKGLEFQYVFLVAADDLAWGKGKGNNSYFTLPDNLIQIRHTGITDDERLRLFFVAITRAKSHLCITNSIKDFSGKTPARLAYLAEYEKDDKIISPYLGEIEVIKHYKDIDEAKKQTDLKANWLERYQKLTPDLRAILEQRVSNYHMSASDLTSFIDIIYSGPQTFYKNRLLRVPSEPPTSQIILGNLIHATFEQITKSQLTDDAAIEFFKQQAEKQPLMPNDLNDILVRGEKSIRTSLDSFSDILRHPHAQAEVNLAHENLSLGDTPILGIIDHINIDPETKTIDIYDFKTGAYKDKKWDSDATLYKYKLQLGFYKLLLNLSPTYSKYKVNSAHILFVSPDQADGLVHDKIYKYNEEDELVLKSLIKSVYHEIKTLNFIEDQNLFLAADNARKLSDLKNFVQLLIDKYEA